MKIKGRYGFTLLEMLAAVAMVSVLAGSLYAGFSISFQARRSSYDSIDPVKEVVAAYSVFGRDIASALVPRGILAGPFIGESEELSFFTRPMRTSDTAAGIVGVRYALSETDNNRQTGLVRYISVNLLAQQEQEPLPELICNGAGSLTLNYFDGIIWLERWDSNEREGVLPVAVRIEIEILPDTGAGSRRFMQVFLLPSAERFLEGAVEGAVL